MAAVHKLALILKNPQDEAEFLLVRQTRPPAFGDEEYDSYVDSDLWDLPSTHLNLLEGDSECQIPLRDTESCSEKINLRKYNIDSALDRVILQPIQCGRCLLWSKEKVEFLLHLSQY